MNYVFSLEEEKTQNNLILTNLSLLPSEHEFKLEKWESNALHLALLSYGSESMLRTVL